MKNTLKNTSNKNTLKILLLFFLFSFSYIKKVQAQEEYHNLKKQVKELISEGKYEQALPIAEKTVVTVEKELGKTNNQYLLAQIKLGEIYRVLGKYAAAEKLYLAMSESDKKQFGETSTAYARGLESLTAVYCSQGKYNEAEKTQNISYNIILKNEGDKSEFLLQSIGNLASVKQYLGKHKEAEKLYQQKLQLQKSLNLQNTTAYAKTLQNYALNYYQMGNYQNAEENFKNALNIIKTEQGEQNIDYAHVLRDLGRNYVALSKYELAETTLNQALSIQKTLLGENNPDYANTLGALGEIYSKKNDASGAENTLKQASETRKKTAGEKSVEYAASLSQLGNFYQKNSRFKEAETVRKQAMSIYKIATGENSADFGRAMIEYAQSCLTLSWLEVAEPYLLRAKDIYTKIYGEKAIQMSVLYTDLADLYMQSSRFALAVTYLEKAYQIDKTILGENNAEFATTAMNFGRSYIYTTQYAEAEKYLKQSLDIRKRLFGDNTLTCAYSYQNLAELYAKMNFNEESMKNAEKAYNIFNKILGNKSIEYAISSNTLGEQMMLKKKFEVAEKHFLEALDIAENKIGKTHPFYILILQNLTNYYISTNKIGQAATLYDKLQAYYMTEKGGNDPNIGSFTLMMALVNEASGKIEMAEKLMEIATGMYMKKFGNDNFDTNFVLVNTILLYMKNGKIDKVRQYYDIFKQNQQIFTDRFFPHFTEQERQIFFQNISTTFEKFCTPMLKNGKSEDLISLYDTQLFTKSLIFNANNKTKRAILESKDPNTIALYEKWQNQKQQNIRYLKLSKDDLKAQNINLDSLEKAITNTEKELSLKTQAFVTKTENISWKDIQGRLKPNQAAIEMIRYREMTRFGYLEDTLVRYAALIIKAQGAPEVVLISNGTELEKEEINVYKNSIQKKSIDKYSYNAFWKKISTKLIGIQKVYFSADGVYNQLSMNALYNFETKKYIIDEINVQIVASTRDIVELSDKQQVENFNNYQAYLVGFPAYDKKEVSKENLKESLKENNKENIDRRINMKINNQKTKQTLSRAMNFADVIDLPGTKTEIDNLNAIIKQANIKTVVLIQADASEERLKMIKKPSILHIATHGFFIPNDERNTENAFFDGMSAESLKKVVGNPLLRSGLLLAGCKKSIVEKTNNDQNTQEDGILTAYETMDLDLENTSLVVLSACETGLGEIVNGEGVYGLQRAIKTAGAQAIIMSLWKVDDAASQEFMTEFYQNWIKNKLSKRDAFAQAQQKIRIKYASPYFWAAFVLIGE